MYGWQGERITVRVNDYQGAPMGSTPVWLGAYDIGHEYKFTRYSATGGIVGVTNSSGTTNVTNPQGFATIQIPDNQSDRNYYGGVKVDLGIAAIAANISGGTNRTFQYVEKCSPNLPNPSLLINCEYNNSYERSYTATPMIIMPNPVNVTTMTPAHVPWNFFSLGAPVAFRVNVSLPTANPLYQVLLLHPLRERVAGRARAHHEHRLLRGRGVRQEPDADHPAEPAGLEPGTRTSRRTTRRVSTS